MVIVPCSQQICCLVGQHSSTTHTYTYTDDKRPCSPFWALLYGASQPQYVIDKLVLDGLCGQCPTGRLGFPQHFPRRCLTLDRPGNSGTCFYNSLRLNMDANTWSPTRQASVLMWCADVPCLIQIILTWTNNYGLMKVVLAIWILHWLWRWRWPY